MKKIISLFVLTVVVISVIGCVKPVKKELLVTIKTNETAFLVPLEGKTKAGQGKFMSVDYLEKAKIATKRITIPQRGRKVGRFDHQIEWIPTMKVIKVDRTPVTREWTEGDVKGTSERNEAIDVESKDSIGFSVGINLTTLVREEDSAKFLYYYSGKTLAQITDNNVRGFVCSLLSREFGSRNLEKCKTDKRAIQEIVRNETIEEFSKYGVTLTNIGLVGGLVYDNSEIQKAINDAYIVEMNIKNREKAVLAQEFENKRLLSIAETERKSAQEFEKAFQAMTKKIELDIKKIEAEALLTAAKRWSGNTPNSILPQGSNLLFGLDK